MTISISAFRFGGSTATDTDTTASKSKTKAAASADSAESAFLNEAKKTPAERLREQILKQMNMTEDDLNKLDPQQRATVEDSIKQKMLQMAQANGKTATGVLADVTA